MLTRTVFGTREHNFHSLRTAVTLPEADYWHHSIQLPDGTVTAGSRGLATLEDEWRRMRLPDLRGASVLDIGAWDGWFSFAAERVGAGRVVALDHFVWSLDLRLWAMPRDQQLEYQHNLRRPDTGEPYDLAHMRYEEVPELWQPDRLPGKKGFDWARARLGSGVESVVADFMTCDLAAMGVFDVVLFIGVLYHLRHPLLGLERLRRVTASGGLAVVETLAMATPGHEHEALWRFYEGDGCGGDPTNWWVPNAQGVIDACLAAGFSSAIAVEGPPSDPGAEQYRAIVHARA